MKKKEDLITNTVCASWVLENLPAKKLKNFSEQI